MIVLPPDFFQNFADCVFLNCFFFDDMESFCRLGDNYVSYVDWSVPWRFVLLCNIYFCVSHVWL
jgi:hypothetical protein